MEIVKSTGEKVLYDEDKFCTSLARTGAPQELVEEVCDVVDKHLTPGMTTLDIFRKASTYLMKRSPHIGIRYNLKKGLMELGPAGFRFEQFVE